MIHDYIYHVAHVVCTWMPSAFTLQCEQLFKGIPGAKLDSLDRPNRPMPCSACAAKKINIWTLVLNLISERAAAGADQRTCNLSVFRT